MSAVVELCERPFALALPRLRALAMKPTDEPFDALVHRPLATRLVHTVTPLNWVTANRLTLASMTFGVAAGVLLGLTDPRWAGLGSILLFGSMVLDCSDGQLARIRGTSTLLGRVIDGLGDYAVAISVHVGMLVGLWHRGFSADGHLFTFSELFLLMLAAGASNAIHAGRFDYLKWRYLALRGEAQVESPELYRAEADKCSSAIARVVLRLFAHYVGAQQSSDKNQLTAEKLAKIYSNDELKQIENNLTTQVRAHALIGPTTHNVVIATCALFTPFYPFAPVAYIFFTVVCVTIFAVGLSLWGRVTESQRSQPPRPAILRSRNHKIIVLPSDDVAAQTTRPSPAPKAS